jgi:hypothetical protein
VEQEAQAVVLPN